MPLLDYNTNNIIQGLRGLKLNEGDPDYAKKKMYQDAGYSWKQLAEADGELAYKWASELAASDPYRDNRTPVSDQEVLDVINTLDTPLIEERQISVPESLRRMKKLGDEYSAYQLANAQKIMDATGYGNSKYDTEQDLTLSELSNLQDVRGVSQSGAAKLGVSALKAATLAGTTALDGTLGFIYGVGAAIGNQNLNSLNSNTVSDALQGINDWMEEVAPVYHTKDYDEKPWYQKLNTVDLWADGVLKNMGFTVGALWSGSAATRALRAIPKVAKSIKAQETLGSIYSAVSEGRIEANHTYHELLDSQTASINESFQRYIASIKDDPNFDQLADEAENQRQLMLAKAEENASKAGVQNLVANTVALSVSNYSTFGRMFSKDFNLNKRLLFNEGKYSYDKQSVGGALATIGKDMLMEGNEEMVQRSTDTWSKLSNSVEDPDYYNKAFLDAQASDKTFEALDMLGEAFIQNYADPNAYEEFFAGAVTGLIGIPTFGRNSSSNNESIFQNKPVSWQGGIVGKLLARSRDNEQGEQDVNDLNAGADKLRSQGNYFTRQTKLLNDMEGYIEEDDRFSYENTQDGLDFNTFSVFHRTGRMDDLKQIMGYDFENMSDEELTELVKPYNYTNNDGTPKTDSPEGLQSIRQELIENQKKMFDRLNAFEQSYEIIQKLMPQLNDEQVTDLAWYHWKQRIFNERFNEVRENNKEGIEQILETVNKLINRNENEFKNAISPAIKEQTAKLKVLQPFLEKIAEAKQISDAFMATDENGEKRFANLATKALEYMLQNKSILNNSGMDIAEYKKAINAINDITRMSASVKSFNSKLQEYLQNPEKLQQERQKEEKKNEEKNKVTNQVKNEADLIRKPINELVQMDIDGKISIDNALKTAGANSESAKHLAKAKALRAAYLKKLDEAKQKLQNPVQFNAYKNALKNTLKTATKPEDLNNVTIEQSSGLDDSLEEVMRQADNIDTSALEEALETLNAEALEASVPNTTDVDNIDTSSLEEAASGRDGQPQIPAVNLEQGLGDNTDISSQSNLPEVSDVNNDPWNDGEDMDAVFNNTIKRAVYNLLWVNDGVMPLEQFAKMLSDNNSMFTGMSLQAVIDTISDPYSRAARIKKALLQNYDNIWDKVFENSKQFDKKEDFMNLLNDLSNAVNRYVKMGNTDPSIIISQLSDLRFAALNNSKNANENSLSVYVKALVDKFNENKETQEVETEKPIEEIEAEQKVKVEAQPENTEANQDEVVTEDETPSNTQKENNKNTYWRPNVAEIPFGDLFREDPRNYTPLWQRLAILLDKGEKAVKAGIARIFGGENRKALAQRSMVIGKYLDDNKAYQRANKGEIEVGDTVYFKIDAELNRNANDFVVLMTNSKGVIGDLAALGDAGINNSILLKDFVQEIKRQYEEAGSPETWKVPNMHTEVNELMRGKAPYNNEANSLQDVFGDRLKGATFIVHPITKLPSIQLTIMGRPMSFTFITPYLNTGTRNKNLGKHITNLLHKAIKAKNNDERMQFIKQINSLITDDIVVYSEPNGGMTAAIISQHGTRTNIFKNQTIDNSNINDAIDSIWEELYGTQVIITEGFNVDFADGIFINLPKDMQLVGSWFTVNPITPTGDMVKPGSVRDNKASYIPTTPNRKAGNAVITINSNSYNINLETWNVTDSKGKVLSVSMNENDPTRQALAEAVVRKNGWDLNSSHQTMWGMYKPSNNVAEITQEQNPIQKATELLNQGKTPTISDLFSDNTSSVLGKKLNEERKTTDRGIILTKTQYENGYELKVESGDNYVRQAYTTDGRVLGGPKFALDVKNPLTDKYLHTTPSGMFYVNQNEILDAFNATVAQSQPSQQSDKFDSLESFRKEHPELSKYHLGTIFQKYQHLPKEEAYKKIKRDLDNRNKNIMLREETSSKDKGVTNAEKEWFAQAFPQLSTTDRMRIVENLQHKGVKAWGMFKNGVITLANKAASGTLYHEAFHAVTHCLLTTDEKFDMFSEAQKKYGNHLNKRELEENLAEDFRRYMQFSEMPFVGKIVKMFRSLKHWIKTLAGNESAIDKLMYEIASGKLKDRSILNYTDNIGTYSEDENDINYRIDEDNNLVVYHGSPAIFENFDINKSGSYIGDEHGIGIYVSSEKEVAVKIANDTKNNPNNIDNNTKAKLKELNDKITEASKNNDWDSYYDLIEQRNSIEKESLDNIPSVVYKCVLPSNNGFNYISEHNAVTQAQIDAVKQILKNQYGNVSDFNGITGKDLQNYIKEVLSNYYNKGVDLDRIVPSILTEAGIIGMTIPSNSLNPTIENNFVIFDPTSIQLLKRSTNQEEYESPYFRYIDFSSNAGVQEHLDKTINNMQGRTKQAIINEWAKMADIWRAAGINVKAVFQKIGKNPGRMVVKKIEMFNTTNRLTPSRYSYNTLNDEERAIVDAKNMTPQEYDSLPEENKNLIWNCAKLGY